MIVKLQRLLPIGILLFIASFPSITSAQNISETTLSILSYVRWKTDSPIICIIDNDEINKELTTLAQQNNYKFPLYTTNFTEPLSYQGSAFLKLPKFP